DAEDPLRHAALCFHRGERFIASVEVPPAGAIGDEVKCPVRAPLRLEDRLVGTAGDELCLAQGGKLSYPKLCAIPWHAGVIPAEPSEFCSVRAKSRVGVKIAARNQRVRRAIAIDRNGD